jgi:hypothetical protein
VRAVDAVVFDRMASEQAMGGTRPGRRRICC